MTLLLPDNYQSFRTRIRTVVQGLTNASASDQAQAVAHTILEIEVGHGSRFVTVEGESHLFTSFGKKLLTLQHNDPRWAAHLLMVYGINTKDKETSPKVTNVLASYALWNGTKMQPRRWTAYINGALHLSRYDGTVMTLTGAGVEESEDGRLVDDIWRQRQGREAGDGDSLRFDIEDNGRSVLFADDDNGSAPPEPVIGRNGKLFKLLQGVTWAHDTTGQMRPRHQVQALMIWMLASAFPDAFPTKPILMVEGAAGSGKSTLLQMIQQALFGSVDPFTVSEDGERDFWVTLLRSPIMVLDNTDEPIKWLPDAVCAYCTRGYKAERKLHTNTGRVEIRPQSFIAVASKDPKSFRREDTVDRTIVLRIENRRFGTGGTGGDSVQAITAQIARDRAEIYGEWLYYLNRVVAALRLEPPRRTSARLGDFEIFAYAACRALGWQSSVVVPDLMAALARERTAFAAETDVVLDIVHEWMSYPNNAGRKVSVRDLFREMAMLADTSNKPFVKTPQALAQRLRAPHVRVVYEVVETVVGDKRLYQIWAPPAGDAN